MDKALQDLWNATQSGAPFDKRLGICAFWADHYKELGSPSGPERSSTVVGVSYQAFTRGIVRWTPGKGAEIV